MPPTPPTPPDAAACVAEEDEGGGAVVGADAVPDGLDPPPHAVAMSARPIAIPIAILTGPRVRINPTSASLSTSDTVPPGSCQGTRLPRPRPLRARAAG